MRDENDGLILSKRGHLLIQRIFSHRVERRRRLIHDYKVIIACKYTSDSDLLLLTAREVCSLFVKLARQHGIYAALELGELIVKRRSVQRLENRALL